MGDKENSAISGGRFYIEGQPWDGKIAEFKPEDGPLEESEPMVPTVTGSAELTITLTPEQQEAIKKAADSIIKVWEAVKAEFDRLKEAYFAIWERLKSLSTHAISKFADNLMDAMLYAANDNPKRWHYYKHAKKKRNRKKYKRLLMQQLLSALNAQKAEA